MRSRPTPVAVLFVALAGFALTGAVAAIEHAIARGGVARAEIAGYAVVRCVVAAAFAAFVVLRGPARRRVTDPAALAACTAAMGALVAMGAPDAARVDAGVIAGEAVAVAGCAWLLVSVLALGRCFGVLPEARGLVTRGPYRLMRHPVYLGELAAAAGLLLAAPTLRNLILVLGFGVAQAIRMQMEERELTLAFPEYSAYAARTPRLLPRLRVTPRVHTTITTGETT
jgi:protein-S-isoprenylcysteine O-methyltransferase Ste14